MQEIKKRRIVLASILKTVDDTRMFEKMAASLAANNSFEVHVIGAQSAGKTSDENVRVHELPKFDRLSFSRIKARLKVLQIAIKVKPEAFIVTTHELLGVAIVIRILFGTRIVYDVQENYKKNILFTSAFPRGIRAPLALFVRLKEWAASVWISRFVLAESCYAFELGFIGKKYIVCENKCKILEGFKRNPDSNSLQLIFTGTLAESTGVFQAINFAVKLREVEPRTQLKIIGYCVQPTVLEKIRESVKLHPFISLHGGSEIVPHPVIMDAIASASFGLICYPLSPHIENKVPTKLYEYLECQLPILLQNHPAWTNRCTDSHAAITVNFDQPDIDATLRQIQGVIFYSNPPKDANWSGEEEKLLTLITELVE